MKILLTGSNGQLGHDYLYLKDFDENFSKKYSIKKISNISQQTTKN